MLKLRSERQAEKTRGEEDGVERKDVHLIDRIIKEPSLISVKWS